MTASPRPSALPPPGQLSLNRYLDRFLHLDSKIACIHQRGYRWQRWSYRQVAEAAYQFARELEDRGIGKGDRVMLWGENCAEWAVVFWGCVLRGAIVVPMDKVAAPVFAENILRQVDAKLLVRSQSQQLSIAEATSSVPTLTLESLQEYLAPRSRDPYQGPPPARGDMVEIIFTSGATADPKGVVITHGNILANLAPLENEINKYLKYLWLVHPLRFLNLLPLSHVFGQFLGLFLPPLLRGVVIFHDNLNPSEVVRTIRRERVSVVVTVPRLLESLKGKLMQTLEREGQPSPLPEQLERARNEHFVKRWWRFRRVHNQFGWKFWAFICGGAALDADTETFWQRLSFVVIQGYGLTETTSLVSVNHPFHPSRGSVGKPLPGREVKIDEHGEILARGENIASGYWQQGGVVPMPEPGEGQWFHTGDLGAVDEKGNLFFKGRKKEVIVTAEGMNIYPGDLEEVLRAQPEVRDCVVIGVAAHGDMEACAILLLRDRSADAEDVVRNANQSLADYQRIRRWLLWPGEDFPRTSTQKPKTAAIREWAESQMSQADSSREQTGIFAELITRIKGRRPEHLSPQSLLEDDLNLSSIDRVELLSAIEDRYQVELDETQITSATTLGDLEKIVRAPAALRKNYPYPRWAASEAVRLVRAAVSHLIFWPVTMLLSRPRVLYRERMQNLEGPILLVCNHVTMVDIGYIEAALPARLRGRLAVAMSGDMLYEMRRPPDQMAGWRRLVEKLDYFLVAALFNVFSLPQRSGFLESFRYAGDLAGRGYSIVVFPEGRRTLDGALQPFRTGIGLLAAGLGIPVLPMRIDGLFELKDSGRWFTRPHAVTVKFGSPIRFSGDHDPAAIARELEQAIAGL